MRLLMRFSVAQPTLTYFSPASIGSACPSFASVHRPDVIPEGPSKE